MSTLLGYDIQTWEDIYRLYMMDHTEGPKDLGALRRYWQKQSLRTPMNALDLGLKLHAAYAKGFDISPVTDMIVNFIEKK